MSIAITIFLHKMRNTIGHRSVKVSGKSVRLTDRLYKLALDNAPRNANAISTNMIANCSPVNDKSNASNSTEFMIKKNCNLIEKSKVAAEKNQQMQHDV